MNFIIGDGSDLVKPGASFSGMDVADLLAFGGLSAGTSILAPDGELVVLRLHPKDIAAIEGHFCRVICAPFGLAPVPPTDHIVAAVKWQLGSEWSLRRVPVCALYDPEGEANDAN